MYKHPELEWLFILGDDHEFQPDFLARLLSHDKDMVAGLCLSRMPPYGPVAFTDFCDGGPGRWTIRLNDYPDGGLIPVHSVGSAGMVIRRRVLDALTDPWFEYGKVISTETTEDLYFCDKAREAGFGIYCDLDAPFGHLTTGAVFPVREEEGWTYMFNMAGGFQIRIPARPGGFLVEEQQEA